MNKKEANKITTPILKPHNQKACNALADYIKELEWRKQLCLITGKNLPEIDISVIANEWLLSAEELNQHWGCRNSQNCIIHDISRFS